MLEHSTEALRAVALWTGVNLALTLVLALNVTRVRMRANIAVGVGGDAVLERAVRAHGNNAEYVPGALLALLGLALVGHPAGQLQIMGAVLFVARLLHAHGIQVITDGLPPTRAAGNIATWAIYVWASVALVWRGIG